MYKDIFTKAMEILMEKNITYGDIFCEKTKSILLNIDNDKLDKINQGVKGGVAMRIFKDNKTYFAYTENFEEKSILNLAKSLSLKVGNGDHRETLIINQISNDLAFGLSYGEKKTLDEKIKVLYELNRLGRDNSTYLEQLSLIMGDVEQNVEILNSLGNHCEDLRIRNKFICQGVFKDGEKLESSYEATGALGSSAWLLNEGDLGTLVQRVMKNGENLLKAPSAPSGTMDVVLSGEAGGTMVHEACGHGMEADIAMKNMSVYSNKLGEKVASDLITVVDDGTIKGQYGSGTVDDEGTLCQKNVLVENGVLKKYMSDYVSSLKYGIEKTGNGRRESYKHIPLTRMTTTYIKPGNQKKADIISSVQNGLFVEKMGGGQVNTVTGDFVFEVTKGFIIKEGQIKEEVKGATLIGNGPEVLTKIDMVGDDFGYSLGTCGKDGQGVPVADAQPTLRIPQLIVGGK